MKLRGMRIDVVDFRARARDRHLGRVQRCVCCGVLLHQFEVQAGTLFCSDCLDQAKAHDASDPYDEIGEGD